MHLIAEAENVTTAAQREVQEQCISVIPISSTQKRLQQLSMLKARQDL